MSVSGISTDDRSTQEMLKRRIEYERKLGALKSEHINKACIRGVGWGLAGLLSGAGMSVAIDALGDTASILGDILECNYWLRVALIGLTALGVVIGGSRLTSKSLDKKTEQKIQNLNKEYQDILTASEISETKIDFES